MSTTDGSPSNAPRIIAISVSTVSVAILGVCIRLYTRTVIINYASWDDLFIVAAGILSIATSICTVLRTKYGLGRHTWTVPKSDVEPGLKMFYIAILIYNVAQVLVKVSFIFQYLRIFDKGIRRACYIALVIVILYGIGSIGTSILACIPVAAFWNKKIPGKCLGNTKFWYTQSAFNILTDFGIFLLPLPVLIKLKLPKKQKIGLVAIFTVGFFACVVSIVRLRTLGLAANTTDPDWDDEAAATWSMIELNAGIVCACLQTLKPFVRKFAPETFTTTQSETLPSTQCGISTRPDLEANTTCKSISRKSCAPLSVWNMGHHESSTDQMYDSDAYILETVETAETAGK